MCHGYADMGAAIGVVVSLPLSMSKVGDTALIGALLGTLVGRHIGDQHVEVLFVTPRAPALSQATYSVDIRSVVVLPAPDWSPH